MCVGVCDTDSVKVWRALGTSASAEGDGLCGREMKGQARLQKATVSHFRIEVFPRVRN